jgi:hypothetical protein
MKQMEDRFNWWAGYDYVFLNDEPFDDTFKEHTQRLNPTIGTSLIGLMRRRHPQRER